MNASKLLATSATAVVVTLISASVTWAQRAKMNGGRPVVAPDGNHIVFSSDRDGQENLYLMDADGSNPRPLTTGAEAKSYAGWMAAGMALAYTARRGDTATLYSVPLSGGTRTALGVVVGQGVRIMPDGAHIIFGEMPWQTMQLFMARLDGSDRHQLTPGSAAFYCNAASPDGAQIAMSRSESGRIQVWVLDVRTSAMRQTTRFAPADGNPQCPDWSPDGRTLAVQSDVFDKDNPTNNTSHLWRVDVATGAATKLGAHAKSYLDELPAWFPDGKRIAFQSSRTGKWEVWVMNADGGDARQLTK